MRSLLTKALALPLILALAAPTSALEKTSRRLTEELNTGFSAATTVTLAYYNNCTGWVWTWSGWSPGEQMGVCYDTGTSGGTLNTTWALTFSPAPSGYGFTGTISVEDACDCTGTVLASQPFLPAASGWNAMSWTAVGVPQVFLVNITWAAMTGFTNGTGLASDHPFAGPTGPTACGTCFPTTRTVNSLYFGVGGSACPGSTLSDGLCDIEFMLEAALKPTTSVEDVSWGQVKALYQ